MEKQHGKLILDVITAVVWTILIFLLGKFFNIKMGYNMGDALFFISLSIIILGLLLIMGRSSTRAPVDFTSRSHALLPGRTIHKFLTNDGGRKYGYDYTWKSFFNGYCVLAAGIFSILYDFIFI